MTDHNSIRYKKSNAKQPDLDWSQIRETISMLGLAIGQIEIAMRDSNESVDVLTNSFTSMFEHLKTIEEATQKLPDDKQTLPIKQAIESDSRLVSAKMQEAIVAFQFYDKLTQRLGHVSHGIEQLAELIDDKSKLFNPDEWVKLQQDIQSKYTMEEERVMFEALVNGASIHEALEIYLNYKTAHDNAEDDRIELF